MKLSTKHKTILKYAFLFIVLVILTYKFNNVRIRGRFGRVHHDKGILLALYLLSTYFLSVFSLCVLFLWKHKIVRYCSFFIVFIFSAIFLSYRNINHDGYSIFDAKILVNNFFFASDAFSTFSGYIIWPTIISFLVIGFIFIMSEMYLPKVKSWRVFIASIFLFVLCIRIQTSGLHRANTFMLMPWKVPVHTYLALQNRQEEVVRKKVFIKPGKKALAKHIIFLLGESVRGDKLSINGFKKETTPFLKSMKNISVISYGVASSVTNCSRTSSIFLQSSIKQSKLPGSVQDVYHNPNIFQYMKEAGYQNVYIDGQNQTSRPYYDMTYNDFKFIDKKYNIRTDYKGIKQYEIDYKIAEILKQVTASDVPTFTYVVKIGCHFAYQNEYPTSEQHFKPVLEDGAWNYDKLKTENTYYNAIRWQVDGFFKKMWANLKGRDVVVLYTSDHGQSLLDFGPEDKITHCAPNPSRYQANVPLFVIGYNNRIRNMLMKKFIPANVNKLSHFEIFPTLLLLSGYNRAEVTDLYGLSIFDKVENRQRIFYSRGLAGKKNVFDRID